MQIALETRNEATLQNSVMVMQRAVQLRRPDRPTKRHRMHSKPNKLNYTGEVLQILKPPRVPKLLWPTSLALDSRQRTLPRKIWP